MNTKALSSFFVLFAVVAGISVFLPSAYADHATASVSIPAGTSVPGCETTDSCFVPSTVTIDVGGEVTWSNDDTAAHTVTSGTAVNGPDGVFDSSLFMAGTTFSFKFDGVEPGEYPYFCMVHPWMEGVVIVQAAGMEEPEEEHMEGEAVATGMLSDGTEINILASAPTAGERMEITIEFHDAEHVNYDVVVTQKGQEVLADTKVHEHGGMGTHMTAPLGSNDPVDITITFQGYGVNAPFTGPIGEKVVFTNVVPEFGTIAMMILGVALVSIIAVTTRSKIIPRI
jgi:predicted secreted protein with PEFG-CTERM motif